MIAMCCTKCNTTKSLADFGRRHDRQQPYRQCRSCMADRRWGKKNPERMRLLVKSWERRNPERTREIWRAMVNRRRNNPAYRLHGRVSNQVWQKLRGKKNKVSVFELLGYTAEQLKEHLERQFEPGMSWDNAKQWHIDHIAPLSSFHINGPDDPELRRAWGLPNLRPLWAKDNLKKGKKQLTLL